MMNTAADDQVRPAPLALPNWMVALLGDQPVGLAGSLTRRVGLLLTVSTVMLVSLLGTQFGATVERSDPPPQASQRSVD